MSTETPQQTSVEIDDLAAWVEVIDKADAKIKELEGLKKLARQHIETRLGDQEVGTIAGHPAVRWTVVVSRRLDQAKLKAEYPDLAEALTVPSVSRRFTVVKDDQ